MAENPETEWMATQTILQRGVIIKLAAPFWLKPFKKTIGLTITSPYEGTMHRVANYYLSTGIKADQLEGASVEAALALMAMHGKAMSKAVATAILNGYWSGLLFTKPLAWYLRWHCKPQELLACVSCLTIYGGVADFMNTTKLVRKMKLTTPKMGQTPEES